MAPKRNNPGPQRVKYSFQMPVRSMTLTTMTYISHCSKTFQMPVRSMTLTTIDEFQSLPPEFQMPVRSMTLTTIQARFIEHD